MRALVEDKVQTLERYAGKTASPVQAWVEVERTTQHHQRGPYYRVEIHLRVDGQTLRSHSRGVSVDAALLAAKIRAQTELRKRKERRVVQRRRLSA